MSDTARLLDGVIAAGLVGLPPLAAWNLRASRRVLMSVVALGGVAGALHFGARGLESGTARALVVIPVAALALYGVACGAHRLLSRRTALARELVIDFALATPGVAVLWLAVYHSGSTFRGFGDFWAALTAAHFLYAGFGLSLAVGLVGRALVAAAPRLLSVHAVLAWGLMLALPVLALGIDGRRSLEVVGVLMYGVLLPLHAVLGVVVAARSPDLPAAGRALLALACLALLVTTIFALGYGLLRHPALDLGTMLKVHGAPNALVVVLGTLTAFALRR